MKQEIITLLQEVIQKEYSLVLEGIQLENPPKKDLGDYAFGCFVLSKELKTNPAKIASGLGVLLEGSQLIEKVSTAGPYINITVSKTFFTQKFMAHISKNELSEVKKRNKGKTIYIDYIGVCVGKVLHVGHICTPLIGETMVRVFRKYGYMVISDSHLGDWGIIFGKLIASYKKYGNEEELSDNAVKHLFELYIKINKEEEENPELGELFRSEFKKLASGDSEYAALWERFTLDSIEAMEKQFVRLGVEPDYHIGESFYEGLPLAKTGDFPDLKYSMNDIVTELIEKGIATQNDDNSVGIEFGDDSKIPSCILQKRDGTHGYLASDLASIKYRKENWNPEKIIYCVDVRQQLHFQQAFETARLAGWLDDTQLFHAYNGFISLKDGAMSTRTGHIVPLDSVLDEAEERARNIILEKRQDFSEEELQALSKQIGIGAIKYGYLKKNRESDVVFDWDEFMSFEGNSGPYIQYAYVRARKMLAKAEATIDNKNLDQQGEFSQREEVALAKKIMDFDSVLEECMDKNYPHILTQYAFELTKMFSSFYNNVRVYDEEDIGKKKMRILLVDTFSKRIKEVFSLLGIEMPEKM